MDLDYCITNYLDNYNLFIEQLSYLFEEEEYKQLLLIFNSESKDKKWLKIKSFNTELSDEFFEQFINSKLKLFTHKTENNKKLSESFFGSELSLKKIFNNRDDNIKFVLWSYLHLMELMFELAQITKNKDRIKKLTKLITTNSVEFEKTKVKVETSNKLKKNPKDMIKEILNVDINNETNDMITEILGSFNSSLCNSKDPFSGIMNIGQQISDKYKTKIENGDIEINKLMDGITSSMPNIQNMLKMDIFGKKKNKEEVQPIIIDENFSTSCVEQPELKDEKLSGMKIGNILSIADGFGVLPLPAGANDNSNNMDGIMSLFQNNGTGDNNIMNMMQDMMKNIMPNGTPGDDNIMQSMMQGMMHGMNPNEGGENIMGMMQNMVQEMMKNMGTNENTGTSDGDNNMMNMMQNMIKSLTSNESGDNDIMNMMQKMFKNEINEINEETNT